jgi:hypothetical protein
MIDNLDDLAPAPLSVQLKRAKRECGLKTEMIRKLENRVAELEEQLALAELGGS